MAFSDESGNGMVMPVAPMYGGGNGNGFGFGGDWAWIILLLLLGWGNNGWGNGYDGGAGGLYPWMNQTETINDGFRDQMLNTSVTSIRDSIGDISTQLCNGFAGVNAGVANGFAQAEISANARQMADMNQRFALQSQLASCCCENRLGTADLKYTIATEACADRAAVTNALENVIANQTANTQRILDQMCSDRLDDKNAQIMALERQLAMANLAASQTAQTAEIISRLPAATTTA